MKVNKGSVEQNGNITFTVNVEPSPSTKATVEVNAFPVAGGKGYRSIRTLHPNENACDVTLHIPVDAATGTWKVTAVKVAPISGTYRALKVSGEPPTFEVTNAAVVLPESAQIEVKQ
jgi:hypothetical protein